MFMKEVERERERVGESLVAVPKVGERESEVTGEKHRLHW